jgi:hypothetical protein
LESRDASRRLPRPELAVSGYAHGRFREKPDRSGVKGPRPVIEPGSRGNRSPISEAAFAVRRRKVVSYGSAGVCRRTKVPVSPIDHATRDPESASARLEAVAPEIERVFPAEDRRSAAIERLSPRAALHKRQ